MSLSTSVQIPWAVISDQTLAGTASSVSFANIPQNFTHLKLIATATVTNSTNAVDWMVQFNGDTGSNYDRLYELQPGTGGSPPATGTNTQTGVEIGFVGGTDAAGIKGVGMLEIPFYQVSDRKNAFGTSTHNTGGTVYATRMYCQWRNTAAITSLVVLGGTFAIGSRFILYGLK